MSFTSLRYNQADVVEGIYSRRNYLKNHNGDFHLAPWSNVSVATWSTATGPSGVVTIGGATNFSPNFTNTNPLIGEGSIQLAKNGSNAQGQGIISGLFTLDRQDLGKVLSWFFSYELSAGAANFDASGTPTQSLEMWIYDVTAAAWIQPSGYRGINQTTGAGRVIGNFQSALVVGQQYRLAIFQNTTVTTTYTINLDDFYLGGQNIVQGTPITDWASYIPVMAGAGAGTSTLTGKWRRIGDSMEIQVMNSMTVAGTGATVVSFTIPGGNSIDTAKMTAAENIGWAYTNSIEALNQVAIAPVLANTTTTFLIYDPGSNANAYTGADYRLNSEAVVRGFFPISGWSSNVQMSNDTDTRVVALSYAGTPTGTLNNSVNLVTFPTKIVDTHSSYSAGVYTVPVSGIYRISAFFQVGGTIATNNSSFVYIFKNGTTIYFNFNRGVTGTSEIDTEAELVVSLNAGDLIDIRSQTDVTTPTFSASGPRLSIERMSGPSVIAANETVACRYTGTVSTPAINIVTTVVVAGNTKVYDTHGAYSTSTGLFTCPVSGIYQVGFQTHVAQAAGAATNAFDVQVLKNGIAVASRYQTAYTTSSVEHTPGIYGVTVKCVAGDTLGAYVGQNLTGSLAAWSNNNRTYIDIVRVGN